MNQIYCQSERLYLRKMTREDQPFLLDLNSRPEVMKFISDGKPSTTEEISETLERVISLYEKYENKFGVWAAIERTTQKFTGFFILRPDRKDPDNLTTIELGYRFKPDYWGMGLATEMSLVLLKKAFTELGAISVFATAMAENKASIHAMEKIRMKLLNLFVENEFPGIKKNAVKYQILKKDWEAAQFIFEVQAAVSVQMSFF
jgi:RimJ/RimL family protein N-acetyltransferase